MKGSFIFASNLHSFLTTAEGFAFQRRKIWEHTHFFYGFREPQKQLEPQPSLLPAGQTLYYSKRSIGFMKTLYEVGISA